MNCLSSIAIITFNLILGTYQQTHCGSDWTSFKDEKCFKLLDSAGTQTYDQAIEACKKLDNSSTLASINTAEEQEWVKNFVYVKHKTVDNVWIGAKRDNMTFVWEDGSKLSYTNWFDINSLNRSGNDCIELETDIGYSFESKAGKWTAVACIKRNLALCQLFQTWPLPHVQKVLTEFRKEMKDFVQNAHQNPVPINFTYVQLPSQPEPKTLWPTVVWTDISSQYAGQFFRVLGNNSNAFGDVQEENSPHLTEVESQKHAKGSLNLNIKVPQTDAWSDWVYSGSGDGNDYFIRFKSNGGEVRPRNQAIKIWKRTK